MKMLLIFSEVLQWPWTCPIHKWKLLDGIRCLIDAKCTLIRWQDTQWIPKTLDKCQREPSLKITSWVSTWIQNLLNVTFEKVIILNINVYKYQCFLVNATKKDIWWHEKQNFFRKLISCDAHSFSTVKNLCNKGKSLLVPSFFALVCIS